MKNKLKETITNFSIKLFELYLIPINLILNRCDSTQQKDILIKILKRIKLKEYYMQLTYVPKKINSSVHSKQSIKSFSDIAIIIQGPLNLEDAFTYETAKMYYHYYRDINIIVSTWKDSDMKEVEKLKHLGAHVVLSDYPPCTGIGNINYQLRSTVAGIETAKALGVKYIWKTRSDQRYYNPCALILLLTACTKDRLVFLGGVANSFIKRYFQLSDYMCFGTTATVECFYQCNYDDSDHSDGYDGNKNADKNISRFNDYIKEMQNAEISCEYILPDKYDFASIEYSNPEVLLTYNFYNRITTAEDNTKLSQQYERLLKKYVSIVDAESLGWFWLKYNYFVFKEGYFDKKAKLDCAKWLSICDFEN